METQRINELNEPIFDTTLALYLHGKIKELGLNVKGTFGQLQDYCQNKTKEEIDARLAKFTELSNKMAEIQSPKYVEKETKEIYSHLQNLYNTVKENKHNGYNPYLDELYVDKDGKNYGVSEFEKNVKDLMHIFGSFVENDKINQKIADLEKKVREKEAEIRGWSGNTLPDNFSVEIHALNSNKDYLNKLKSIAKRKQGLLSHSELNRAMALYNHIYKSLDYSNTKMYANNLTVSAKLNSYNIKINDFFDRYRGLINNAIKTTNDYSKVLSSLPIEIDGIFTKKGKVETKPIEPKIVPPSSPIEPPMPPIDPPKPDLDPDEVEFKVGDFIVFNGNIHEALKTNYIGLVIGKKYEVKSVEGTQITIKTENGEITLSSDSFDSLSKWYSKTVKDVSESTDLYEIVKVIRDLNPNAIIRVGNPSLDSLARERFYSSVPGNKLILPEGFYYNDKNGITNKHKTQSGKYVSLAVEDLSLAKEETLLPLNFDKPPIDPPKPELDPDEVEFKPGDFVVFNGNIPEASKGDYFGLVKGQKYEVVSDEGRLVTIKTDKGNKTLSKTSFDLVKKIDNGGIPPIPPKKEEEKVVFTGFIPRRDPYMPISDYVNLTPGKEYTIKSKSSNDSFYQLNGLDGKHFHKSSFMPYEKWEKLSDDEKNATLKDNKVKKVTSSKKMSFNKKAAIVLGSAGLAGLIFMSSAIGKVCSVASVAAAGALAYAEGKFEKIGKKEEAKSISDGIKKVFSRDGVEAIKNSAKDVSKSLWNAVINIPNGPKLSEEIEQIFGSDEVKGTEVKGMAM